MKRNAIDKIAEWGNSKSGPLFLYGMPGTGKTYLCNEYAQDFKDSFLYYRTTTDLNTEMDISDHLEERFGIGFPELNFMLLIFDDTEINPEWYLKLITYAVENECKWIFVSTYDYLKEEFSAEITKLKLFPMQFDEFLIALGNEWYVETIKNHYKSKKKLPDIVHEELVSSFEEYLWVGGMPEAVNEYLSLKVQLNVPEKQHISSLMIYEKMNLIIDLSLNSKCRQIVEAIAPQLNKANRKFMFNKIRTGVTYKMYADAINELIDRNMVIKVDSLDNDKNFKLYYPEFSLNRMGWSNEFTDVEYMLRLENYLIQTFKQKDIECCFWESGNRAELPLVLKIDGENIPVDIQYEGHSNTKSVLSFKNKQTYSKILKICDSNFVDDGEKTVIPAYSCFCL